MFGGSFFRMWKVVHIVPKLKQADLIKTYLEAEGFLVSVKEGTSSGFEIRVPASEAQEASELLYEYRCWSKSG